MTESAIHTKGKALVVSTSASSGIGLEPTKLAAANGLDLHVAADQSFNEALRSPARTRIETTMVNLSNGDGVDVLAIAAWDHKRGRLAEMSDEDFGSPPRISRKGPFKFAREAGSRLRDGARIIDLAPGDTVVLQPGHGGHAAKAGVDARPRIRAKKLRRRNFAMHAVASGPVAIEPFRKDKPKKHRDTAAR